MKKLLPLLATILVAILVALTYYYFEAAVRHSINYIWDDLLNTGVHRALVIPIAIVLSLVFFGLQHYLDPKSEVHEAHGLGEAPTPTIVNFAKVLFLGFFSLVAGASLGPEAILVPACLVIGGYVGVKLFKKDKQMVSLMSMAGFVALFAAFFSSFIAGILGLLLMTRQVKVKLNAGLIIFAALASIVSVLVLKVLSSSPYTKFPATKWNISFAGIVALVILFLGGCLITYSMSSSQKIFDKGHALVAKRSWWLRSLIASAGLSALYLLGGTLVEFTGNESIVPMLKQSASLGLVGLLWILIIKVLAIGWSKKFGYRGGLIFPSIFVASILVSIVHIYAKDMGFTIGIVAVLVGMFVTNAKLKILF